MVTIVVGVGATRGYRHTLMGAAAGLVVLVVVVAVAGIALAAIPIGPLRLVIGSLLLLFGLQWYRKGIVRVAARGFAGYHGQEPKEGPPEAAGFDATAAFLAFKGVSLEGLEIAIIVVSVGASAGQLGPSIVGGAAALVLVGAPAEIIASIPNGFYVTELMGFGVNVVTGDYSRGAAGIWIRNGELAFPVSEVTIAGKLQQMFLDLSEIGSDLEFRGATAAPTLMIPEMTVGGR